jgi:hypothetical protein
MINNIMPNERTNSITERETLLGIIFTIVIAVAPIYKKETRSSRFLEVPSGCITIVLYDPRRTWLAQKLAAQHPPAYQMKIILP